MVSLSRINNFSNPLVLFITEKPSKCYFLFYYKLCKAHRRPFSCWKLCNNLCNSHTIQYTFVKVDKATYLYSHMNRHTRASDGCMLYISCENHCQV